MTTDDLPPDAPVQAPDPTVPVEPRAPEPTPAEATASEATEPLAPAEGSPTPRRIDPRAAAAFAGAGLGALAFLLLLLMVFAPSIAPVRLGAVRDAERARTERQVETVAARFATSLYTFNYRTIDADLARIRADATGSFSQELNRVLGEVDVFKEAIIEAEGASQGEVQGVDVRSIEGETASARVFVIQEIRNNRSRDPRSQFSAVELSMVRTSAGWKVDDVRQFRTGASADGP